MASAQDDPRELSEEQKKEVVFAIGLPPRQRKDAVESLCRKYPAQESEIREWIAEATSLAALERVAGSTPEGPEKRPPPPRRLGCLPLIALLVAIPAVGVAYCVS